MILFFFFLDEETCIFVMTFTELYIDTVGNGGFNRTIFASQMRNISVFFSSQYSIKYSREFSSQN